MLESQHKNTHSVMYDQNGQQTKDITDACAIFSVSKQGNVVTSLITHDKDKFYLESFRILQTKDGHFFNPDNKDHNRNAKDKITHEPKFKLKPATKKAFDLYVQFLETRQPQIIRQAEREV